jgi:selenocysteine lyase/cysteine desulfurase
MLDCQRSAFDLDDDAVYLNGAYMSPNLKSVTAAGIEAIIRKSKPYNIVPDDFFSHAKTLRSLFANLIHCEDFERIALIPSVSYGMANASNNISFSRGDEILMIEEQFPSNFYCWKTCADKNGANMVVKQAPNSAHRGEDWSAELLDAIHDKTRVVTLPIVHWADGTIFDIKAITEKAHKHNAIVVIDGTQSIGAMDFDLNEIPVDVLICAAYKWLLGPYSMGFAYYNEGFDKGQPIEESWMNKVGSEDFSGLVNYKDDFKPKAFRYNVGQFSNFTLVPMSIAALQQLTEWRPHNISSYCESISLPIEELGDKFDLEQPKWRAKHLFGIRPKADIDLKSLKEKLGQKRIYVSIRGTSIRVSPNVYNTMDDIHQLCKELLCLK